MKILISILSIFIVSYTFAQKNNYWSTSFNTESSLLAGAVVGGNSDLTSIYYNPAGISEIKDMKFSLNANLFNYSIVNYKNALGEGQNITDYYFLVKPRFISYLYRSKRDTNLSWQFAIFNKTLDDITIYNSVSYQDEVMYNNLENYNGDFDLNRYSYDYRAGIGSSYIINEKLSVGMSVIGMLKGIDYLKSIDVSVYPENIPVEDSSYYFSNWNYYEKIYMYDARILARFGIRYKINRFQLGFVTTLPSFKVMGNSDSKRRVSQNNARNDSISYPDYVFTESSTYLYSQMKDPFSVSAGVMYTSRDKKTKLYFSTEYFAPIAEYKMIDGTRSTEKADFNGTDFLSHYYKAKSIINFGFGYQHIFSEKIEGMLGFKTDFDATEKVNKVVETYGIEAINQNNLNLYHFTAGSKVNAKRGSFIFGFEYIFGYASGLTQYSNFKDLNFNNTKRFIALQGDINDNMSVLYNSFGLYLGFSFGF